MPKKLLLILIGVVVAVLVIGIFLWMRLFGSEQGGGLRSIFPFGQSTDDEIVRAPDGSSTDSASNPFGDSAQINEPTLPPLLKISDSAVAGAYAFARGEKGATTTPMIRHAERATGHIFETNMTEWTSTRLSNTTVPRISEAHWTEGGAGVIFRYLRNNSDAVYTFYGKITPPTQGGAVGKLVGEFLPSGITSLAISPQTDRIFYLTEIETGSAGFVANPDGSDRRELLRLPLRELIADWPSSAVTLATKSSAEAYGYLFSVNTADGAYRRLIGDLKGLTAQLSPDGDTILLSESVSSGFSLSAVPTSLADISKRQNVSRTLPEKCVWSAMEAAIIYCAVPNVQPHGIYPDAWYQGTVSFADSIWRFNTATGEAIRLVDPQILAGVTIDMIHPLIDPEDRYLYFTSKYDNTLWAFRLKP